MSNYAYIAIDPRGDERHGSLDVADEQEAIRRIKEMGWFATRVFAERQPETRRIKQASGVRSRPAAKLTLPGFGRVKPAHLAVFTRQLATLVEAGLPLLRGLRLLEQQEENPTLKKILRVVAQDIENGDSMTEAVSRHPRIFNKLYVNMVRAGEIGGSLEITLQRLAEFMEKAQKIKNRVRASLFYPCAILVVATVIVGILITYVVPRFAAVFADLMEGRQLPAFTRFVFGISTGIAQHAVVLLGAISGIAVLVGVAMRTKRGRRVLDYLKLWLPVLGPLFRKLAVSRFARTLGTLISNGVPILQALHIVKETVGNVIVADVVGVVHENVKQGDPIAPGLKESGIFPAMVGGMVEVGEQTGALPEMLMKVADNYDDQVDNAAAALTSLLEPVMIVLMAVVVGSIVIAMFLPLFALIGGFGPGQGPHGD